jgi:hypothetical protein
VGSLPAGVRFKRDQFVATSEYLHLVNCAVVPVVWRIANERRECVDPPPIWRVAGAGVGSRQPGLFGAVTDLAVKEKTCVTDASAVDVNIFVPAIQWRPLERSAREQRHYHGQDSKAQRNPAAAQLWQRRQHAPVRTTMLTGSRPINLPFSRTVTATPVQHLVRQGSPANRRQHCAASAILSASNRTHQVCQTKGRGKDHRGKNRDQQI